MTSHGVTDVFVCFDSRHGRKKQRVYWFLLLEWEAQGQVNISWFSVGIGFWAEAWARARTQDTM
jgi:hypothetical protein